MINSALLHMRNFIGRLLDSPFFVIPTIAVMVVGSLIWTWQGMLTKSKGGWFRLSNEIGVVERQEGCKVIILENWSNAPDAIEKLNRTAPVNGLKKNGDADAFLVQGGIIFGQSTLRYITATEGCRSLRPRKSDPPRSMWRQPLRQ